MSSTTAIRAGRAFVELFADDTRLVRGLRTAEYKVREFGQKVGAIGRQLMAFGAMVAAPLVIASRIFVGFDDQMRSVQAVVGATGEEFDRLTEKARLLGRTTSFTAAQVAGGMLELGRAGFSPDQIDAAIASVLNLARATGTDLAEATNIAAATLRSFGLEADQMQRVADVMTATANNSAQTLLELGDSMKYASPVADEFGLTLEETAKLLGALANFGIKGSMAGTTVRNILLRMTDPAIRAQVEDLGVAVTDSSKKLRGASDILHDIGKAVDDLPKADKLAVFNKIFGMRAIAGGAKLTTSEFERLNRAIDDAGGTADRTAAVMDGGIGGSFRRLLSAIEGVALAIGDSLDQSLTDLADDFAAIAGSVTQWIQANEGVILSVAAVGGATVVLGGSLVALGAATTLASTGIGVVAGALKVLAVDIAIVSSASQWCAAKITAFAAAVTIAKVKTLAAAAASKVLSIGMAAVETVAIACGTRINTLTVATIAYRAKTIAADVAARAMAVGTGMLSTASSLCQKQIMGVSLAMVAVKVQGIATAVATKAAAAGIVVLSTVSSLCQKQIYGVSVAMVALRVRTIAMTVATKAMTVAMAAYRAIALAVAANPVGAALLAVSAAVVLIQQAVARAKPSVLGMADAMRKLHEEHDAQRETARGHMQRLKELSEKTKLTSAEQEEAKTILAALSKQYGSLGIELDKTTGRLKGVAEAHEKLNKVLAQKKLADINQELRALDKEGKALPGEISGGWGVFRDMFAWTGVDTVAEHNAKIEDRLSEIGRRYAELLKMRQELEGAIDGVDTASPDTSPEAMSEMRQKSEESSEELERWQRRVAQMKLEAIEDEHRRELALIDERYQHELGKAKENETILEQIRKAHSLERAAAERKHQKRLLEERKRAEEEMAARMRDITDARDDLHWQIKRAEIESTQKGTEKELSLLELEYQRRLSETKDPIARAQLSQLNDIQRQAIESRGRLKEASTAARGTFHASAIQSLQSGPDREIVRNLQRLIEVDQQMLREIRAQRLQFIS